MKKGFSLETILFLASLVLCIVCAYAWLRRDDSDFKKFSVAADDLKGNVSSLESTQNKMADESKVFATTTVQMLADLNKRIETLERAKPEAKNVNLTMTEPLRVSVVYRQAQKIPDVPVQVKGKTPLLERAGISK